MVIEEIKEEKKLDTRENSMGDMTPPIEENSEVMMTNQHIGEYIHQPSEV
jgi:hypothetical protein